MKTIVVGYDGTRSSERAVVRAAELARVFGSRVVVASVTPPPMPTPTGAFGLMPYIAYDADVSGAVPKPDEPLWEDHRDRIRALFADADVEVEFAGAVGRPAEEIVEVAEERRADIIVVGTREPGLLERLLGGSVSQGVARRARCDVLIVHPGEQDDEA